MTDEVPRLVDDTRASPALRRALEHALADGPRPAELDALLAAVVGPGPVGDGGQLPPAASGSATGAAGGVLSASLGVKLGALALLSGAVLVGVLTGQGDPVRMDSHRAPARTQLPEVAGQSPRASHGSLGTTSAVPTPGVAPALDTPSSGLGSGGEARRVEVRPRPPRAGSADADPKAEPSLVEIPEVSDTPAVAENTVVTEKVISELELLNRAERLLATDSAQAFELTQRHRREFPAGRLAEEREVIAIEALVRLGQDENAARRFSGFEQRFAGSVHRPRLKRLLGSSGP